MTIKITEIVKYKGYKTTLFLCEINITWLMSWCSTLTSKMTMICNLVRFNFFSHGRHISLLSKYSLSFCFKMISFFVFSKYRAFFSLILKHHTQTNLHFYILKEILNNHFSRHHLFQMKFINL